MIIGPVRSARWILIAGVVESCDGAAMRGWVANRPEALPLECELAEPSD
jgi:hypothetical protein